MLGAQGALSNEIHASILINMHMNVHMYTLFNIYFPPFPIRVIVVYSIFDNLDIHIRIYIHIDMIHIERGDRERDDRAHH